MRSFNILLLLLLAFIASAPAQQVNDFFYVGQIPFAPEPPALWPGTNNAQVDGVMTRSAFKCLEIKVSVSAAIAPVDRALYLAVWPAGVPLTTAHVFHRDILAGDWRTAGHSWFATTNPGATPWPILCYDPSLCGAPISYQVILRDLATGLSRASYLNSFTL